MEVANQRPSVGIVLIDLERLLEPIRGFVNLTAIASHAAQAKIAVNVVAVLTEDTLKGAEDEANHDQNDYARHQSAAGLNNANKIIEVLVQRMEAIIYERSIQANNSEASDNLV